MEYCDSLRMRLAGAENNLDMFERQLERMPQDTAPQREQRQRMAESYQTMTDRLLTQSEHCAQVPPISAEQRAAYWRRAALAGQPAAMRHYASGNAFRYQELLDNLPGLATYRGEAESIARTAAQRGDARMLASLAYAYSPQRDGMRRGFLGQVVRPNAVESLALFLQLRDGLPAQDSDLPRGRAGGPARARGGRFNSRNARRADPRPDPRPFARTGQPGARTRRRTRAELEHADRAGPARPGGAPSNAPPMFLMQGGFVPDVQRQECEGAG
ncbi:hypothetical protein FE772_11035 [Lysobacter enzymogenes]|nr:hypothetical protein [Lysobacter enzymogenes]QCW26126.1 hypothetical protein FE772_11035 [Lysobacter enzymogenes]